MSIFAIDKAARKKGYTLDTAALRQSLRARDGHVHALGFETAPLNCTPTLLDEIISVMQHSGYDVLDIRLGGDKNAASFILYQ